MTSPNRSGPTLDREERLANRATLLTFASLGAFLLAFITMPMTFQSTDAVAARLVASTPLAVGVGVGVAARGARGQLRAFREEALASTPELPNGQGAAGSDPRT